MRMMIEKRQIQMKMNNRLNRLLNKNRKSPKKKINQLKKKRIEMSNKPKLKISINDDDRNEIDENDN